MPTCWQRFSTTRPSVRERYRNEQEYLSHALHEQGKLAYWPKRLVRSFKYHCMPRLPLNHWRAPSIPAGARILIFHGEINPPDAIQGGRTARGRFLLPSPWVTEHWSA